MTDRGHRTDSDRPEPAPVPLVLGMLQRAIDVTPREAVALIGSLAFDLGRGQAEKAAAPATRS